MTYLKKSLTLLLRVSISVSAVIIQATSSDCFKLFDLLANLSLFFFRSCSCDHIRHLQSSIPSPTHWAPGPSAVLNHAVWPALHTALLNNCQVLLAALFAAVYWQSSINASTSNQRGANEISLSLFHCHFYNTDKMSLSDPPWNMMTATACHLIFVNPFAHIIYLSNTFLPHFSVSPENQKEESLNSNKSGEKISGWIDFGPDTPPPIWSKSAMSGICDGSKDYLAMFSCRI